MCTTEWGGGHLLTTARYLEAEQMIGGLGGVQGGCGVHPKSPENMAHQP